MRALLLLLLRLLEMLASCAPRVWSAIYWAL